MEYAVWYGFLRLVVEMRIPEEKIFPCLICQSPRGIALDRALMELLLS